MTVNSWLSKLTLILTLNFTQKSNYGLLKENEILYCEESLNVKKKIIIIMSYNIRKLVIQNVLIYDF